jgi:LDH2 family malate/lactate/ureidoglycolate dehydrogenase
MAIDVQKLMPLPLFQERLMTLIQDIYAAEPASGVQRLVLPGELEARRREARLQHGIPIVAEALEMVQTLAQTLGIQLEA